MPRSPIITNQDMHRLRAWIAYRPATRRVDATGVAALKRKLEQAQVVPARSVESGVVTMHSRIRLRDPGSPDWSIVTLVFPEDERAGHRRVSVLTEEGRAILGRRVGDTVQFDTTDGSRQLVIDEILYQPEAAGDSQL
ncbi:MAG: GreA/GreB family elongation factor [Phycisphaerales bacterium]|nr:GreA/GreB family elongation factor [Phycisphaerales bacterium]